MNPARPKPSASGLLILVLAVFVALGCYQADLYNVPVLAPWLDLLGGWLVRSRFIPPIFFGHDTRMYASAAVVGLVVLILARILVAFVVPSSRVGHMENQMRGFQRTRRAPPTKIE
jgi:hypothetical protein